MFNIAIVGTGIIGLSHIKAIQNVEGCRLSALCDVKEDVVKELAAEHGVPYFLDYKDIPGNVECDAVILNLPHGLHCESTVFFLEHGINVLLEKPMANTVEECERMIEAEKKSGKKLAIAHPQRYFKAAQKIKEIVNSGELGKLCMVSEQRSINYFLDSRPRWFLSKKAAGGGIVMNYGAHALDKLQYITDARVKTIYSNCKNYANDFDVEGQAQILGLLDNGVSFVITFSAYSAACYENYYYFTKGALRSMGSATLEMNKDGKWQSFDFHSDSMQIQSEIEEFVKLLSGEPSTLPDAQYGKDVIAAIEKIYSNNI